MILRWTAVNRFLWTRFPYPTVHYRHNKFKESRDLHDQQRRYRPRHTTSTVIQFQQRGLSVGEIAVIGCSAEQINEWEEERKSPRACHHSNSFSPFFAFASLPAPSSTSYQTHSRLEVALLQRVLWQDAASSYLSRIFRFPFLNDYRRAAPAESYTQQQNAQVSWPSAVVFVVCLSATWGDATVRLGCCKLFNVNFVCLGLLCHGPSHVNTFHRCHYLPQKPKMRQRLFFFILCT